LSNHEARIEDK